MAEEYSTFSLEESPILKHGFSMRRSHLEVRMDILSCVKAGIEKPTQIMYKANLSWTALKEHISVLEAGNFIRTVEYGTRRKYELTEKAVTILMSYKKILDEVNAPEISIAPKF